MENTLQQQNPFADFFANLEDKIAQFSISPLTSWMKLATDPKAPESWVKSTEYYALLASLPVLLPSAWALAKIAMYAVEGSKSLVSAVANFAEKIKESATAETNVTPEEQTNKSESVLENKNLSTAKIHAVVGHSHRRKHKHAHAETKGYSNEHTVNQHKQTQSEIKHNVATKHAEGEQPRASYGKRR